MPLSRLITAASADIIEACMWIMLVVGGPFGYQLGGFRGSLGGVFIAFP